MYKKFKKLGGKKDNASSARLRKRNIQTVRNLTKLNNKETDVMM